MSIERYSRAVESKNLQWRDYTVLDIDWLTAAGLISITDSLPSQVARWLAGDYTQVFPIMRAVQNRYGKSWTLGDTARDQIQDALDWWRDRKCRHCEGRRYMAIPDTPNLSDTPCPICKATGLEPHRHGTQAKAYTYTLALMEESAAAVYKIREKALASA
jgi:hypothetical protein